MVSAYTFGIQKCLFFSIPLSEKTLDTHPIPSFNKANQPAKPTYKSIPSPQIGRGVSTRRGAGYEEGLGRVQPKLLFAEECVIYCF